MSIGYQDPTQAQNYQEFLNSPDGQTQKLAVLNAVLSRLNNLDKEIKILDLGCGPGWLCNELTNRGYIVTGSDASSAQIDLAKKNHPAINFLVADPQNSLPFNDQEFDVVIASLVICDMENQPAALKEINRVLKPKAKLINILPNPYYTMPVAAWKRSFLGFLFGQKPEIKLSPYFQFFKKENREFNWRGNLKRRFYPLSEQINNLISANFTISFYGELKSETDNKKFSREYQIYRFPIYILIECEK